MEITTLTITIKMSREDYARFKSEYKGNVRETIEKAITEKLGGGVAVKSLKAEFGDIK